MSIKIDINVCRVCLQSGKGVKLFDEAANHVTKFTKVTQLKASKGDGLPELLCPKCVARLKIAYDFRVQSKASQDHLLQFLTKVNQFKAPVSEELDDGEEYLVEVLESAYEELDIPEQEKKKPEPVSFVDASATEKRPAKRTRSSYAKKPDSPPPKVVKREVNIKHEEEDEDGSEQPEDERSQEDHQSQGDHQSQDDHQSQASEENPDEEMYEEHIDDDLDEYDPKPNPLALKKRRAPRKSQSNAADITHVCETCNKDFSTRTNLLRHMSTHDGGKPYKCPICGNGFTQNGSLKQHMFIHTGDRPFQCEFCSRGFTQSKSLVFHMRRHTGEKPYSCNECNMSFRQKDGLKRHNAVRHSTEPKESWACEVCGKVFQSKYSVNMHMRKHYSIDERAETDQYACNECERVFSTQNALQAHERQHTIITILKCSKCDMEFRNRPALMEHNLTHKSPSEDKEPVKHQCTMCNTRFTQLSHLHVHMSAQHSKRAKKFSCNICSKSYAILANLEKHMRMHENFQKLEEVEVLEEELIIGDEQETESLEVCVICQMAFESNEQLRQHQLDEHTEEVQILAENDALDIILNCPSCEMKFSDVVELNTHILTEHDAIEAKCDECGADFESQRLFDEHRLEHDLTGK